MAIEHATRDEVEAARDAVYKVAAAMQLHAQGEREQPQSAAYNTAVNDLVTAAITALEAVADAAE